MVIGNLNSSFLLQVAFDFDFTSAFRLHRSPTFSIKFVGKEGLATTVTHLFMSDKCVPFRSVVGPQAQQMIIGYSYDK